MCVYCTVYFPPPASFQVIEESKFPPAVTPLNVQIASFLDDFPGGSIGRVKATDRDLYDR